MSVEIVFDFLETVSEDISLQKQLEQISDSDELICFARQQGYIASKQDFIAATAQLEAGDDELSSSQLTAIAGGTNARIDIRSHLSKILNIFTMST